MSNSRKNKQKRNRPWFAGLWIVTLLASLTVLTGCAIFEPKKIVVHPLVDDFKLVKVGEKVTASKDGALVSDYFLAQVAAVEVE